MLKTLPFAKYPSAGIFFVMLLILSGFNAAAQSITQNAVPSAVTGGMQITVEGTNLTGGVVRVNNVAATTVSNNGTKIVAKVPTITLSAGQTSALVPVVVNKNTVNYPAGSITYKVPLPTNTNNAKITRVITDFQGYWSSNNTTTVASAQPDRQHSVMAVEYGGITYSTGVNNATLTSKGVTYTAGDFRALPVASIAGNTPSNASASNFFAMATRMDGSATAAIPTAPEVAGRKAKDVLIDGIKGLGLGTGITNFAPSAQMEFVVSDIANSRINDAEPDIIVSQIAEPTSSASDVFYFVDANGGLVGNPVSVQMSNVPAIGTYKLDLFNITFNTSYDQATLTTGNNANGTRDIRLVGYKLSDFGITTTNNSAIAGFRIVPSGISDPAFIAYNANSLLIPAPRFINQPVSRVACTGQGRSAIFSVTTSGNNITYQWKKNGENLTDGGNISGATTRSLTITNVSVSDVAFYTVEISNAAGTVLSNAAYLNTIIAVQPANNTACLNSPGPYVEVIANGLSLTYQWYSNTTNSNSGGTAIPGATSAIYTPPASALGTTYYYVVIQNSGQGCATETSTAAAFTVGAAANSGTAYIGGTAGTNSNVTTTSICTGSSTIVRSVGATASGATYQWEQSTDGVAGWNTVSGGSGSNTVNYTTPNLTATTYYRLRIKTSSCEVYSNILTVRVGIDAGTISGNQIICEGTTTNVTISGTTGTIQWQRSTDGETGWANVSGGSGGTTATYTTPQLSATTYYRAVVSGGTCGSFTSNVITVAVTPAPVAGTISANQEICGSGDATVTLTGSTGAIQWQSSTDGTNWTNISDAVVDSYTATNLTTTTYFRAILKSGTCNDVTSGVTIVTVNHSFIWTGAVSSNWNVAGNWSCNRIPTLEDDVIIPLRANQPVVTDNVIALGKTLTVLADAVVTVNPMRNIHILGAITVASTGNVVVSSTANLIQDAAGTTNTNTGTITVKRDSSPLYRQDYTLWSTPVEGQKLFQFSPQTLNTRFYTYNPETDLYMMVPDLNAQATTTFTTGVAYLIRMPNANSAPGYNAGTTAIILNQEFKGVPNNGTYTIPVSLALNRYNGIGNPYPSAINVTDFIDGNNTRLDNLGTLYFWRKKNNNANTSYATLTKFAYSENNAEGGDTGSPYFVDGNQANWIINPGQGFIIRATPGTNNVTFTNAMRRAANNTQYFRNGNTPLQSSQFKLNIVSGAEFGQTVIGYSDATTANLDYGYDGILINDGNTAIYTSAENTDLSIQAKGQFEITDVVPVSYRVTNPGTYNLSLKSLSGVFAGTQKIFVKDNVTNVTHNLKDSDYSFTTQAGTFVNRFEIVYQNVALGTGDNVFNAEQVVVYKQESNLNINSGTAEIKDVKLFDTRGRLVHEVKNINASSAVISNIAVQEQVLIVQITTAEGAIVSKKVVY